MASPRSASAGLTDHFQALVQFFGTSQMAFLRPPDLVAWEAGVSKGARGVGFAWREGRLETAS